ncbi:zinc metalloproteinase nas-39-like [Anneissia japonica]|uniref:zinc metalloproteinase nas-39-like n=1 Tax=Anneissia japonica TaxID=1529436 RepID=UPI001425AEE9|nr:zinc metalloproteinase nas-39-like [Anneissia japonica]
MVGTSGESHKTEQNQKWDFRNAKRVAEINGNGQSHNIRKENRIQKYYWCEHGECVDRYADTRSFIVHNKTRNRISSVKCFGISCLGKTNSNDFSDDNTIFEDPVRFTSPNFPDDYPTDTDQSYIIKAPRDHVVDIEFYVFHLEHHRLCLYDYLQIFDVSSEEYSIFCGLLLTPFHMTSQGSVLRLEFHSDTNVQKPGFLAKIIFLPSFVMNNS